MNSIQQPTIPPPGALVIQDAFDVYLKSLPQGVIPEALIVAKESSALQSIRPLIDNQQHVESIIDPGLQIIAMAEGVCIDLGLIYDPTIILNMQSANGEIDKSLGVARNVPMRIGDITLYVQIHIIRSPAYNILLGRPFDILTKSVVHNFANEDQTITIFDPNTGRRATVPTQARGKPQHVVLGDSEGLEVVAGVWCCLVVSLDRLSCSVPFAIHSACLALSSARLIPFRQAAGPLHVVMAARFNT
jgi:hypothetical protein